MPKLTRDFKTLCMHEQGARVEKGRSPLCAQPLIARATQQPHAQPHGSTAAGHRHALIVRGLRSRAHVQASVGCVQRHALLCAVWASLGCARASLSVQACCTSCAAA